MPYVRKKESEKKVKGRPMKEISKRQFEELCKIQCTEIEICAVLGVGKDKLSSWCIETYGESFSQCIKKYSECGKTSLRRSQFKLSQVSAPMAIWLGKQYLGQQERINNNYDFEDDDDITKAIKEEFKQ